MNKRKISAGFGATVAVAGGVTLMESSPVSAASWTATCHAQKSLPANVPPIYVDADVSITLNASISGSVITLQTISYSFSNHYVSEWPTGFYRTPANTGPSSNVNILSPQTRYSNDNLGTAGTWNFPDFDVKSGDQIEIQGIPDFQGMPDPSCKVWINV